MAEQKDETISLYIKTQKGETFDIKNVSKQTRIIDIKKMMAKQKGTNCQHCFSSETRLIYAGKQTEDNQTLADCGVNHNASLHAVFRLRGLANVSVNNGKLQITDDNGKSSFEISSFHVSCRSDKYTGQNMMGVVIYLYNDTTLWNLNGMKMRPGYILLVNSDKLDNIQTKDNTRHSKAFKYFVGKDLRGMNIVGGGFGYQNGALKFNSGTFNQSKSKYHNDNRQMSKWEIACIKAAFENWKKNGTQNTKVSDVACPNH